MTAAHGEARHTAFDVPVGRAVAICDDAGLAGLSLYPGREQSREALRALRESSRRADDDPLLRRVTEQLAEYFAGTRRRFELPLDPRGTPFQRRVWSALLEIPYGTTTSYRELAARLGRPGALRAVGRANGRNPLAIVIPCHRVIGSDGRLAGYAAGLAIKRALLQHEGAIPAGLPLFDRPAARAAPAAGRRREGASRVTGR